MPIIYDEVNQKAYSGSEQMMRGLESRIDSSLLRPFSIGRAIMLFNQNSQKIYWTHNIPGQMNVPSVREQFALSEENRWNYVDNIVFVSEWQKQKYMEYFKFTSEDEHRFIVMPNAITPIEEHTKPTGKIRLIYTSVPERGLRLLYEAFNNIADKYDIELEVFSSYNIYGNPTGDIVHRQTLDLVRSHPKIRYHGSTNNAAVREALKRSHIHAYPSTFLETSCISLIESMSAGLICVHPDLGALPETSGGYTNMYEHVRNPAEHIKVFQKELEKAISQVGKDMSEQKTYADNKYSWDNRVIEWETYLNEISGNSGKP